MAVAVCLPSAPSHVTPTLQFALGIAKKLCSWVLPRVSKACWHQVRTWYRLMCARPLSDGVRRLRLPQGEQR